MPRSVLHCNRADAPLTQCSGLANASCVTRAGAQSISTDCDGSGWARPPALLPRSGTGRIRPHWPPRRSMNHGESLMFAVSAFRGNVWVSAVFVVCLATSDAGAVAFASHRLGRPVVCKPHTSHQGLGLSRWAVAALGLRQKLAGALGGRSDTRGRLYHERLTSNH